MNFKPLTHSCIELEWGLLVAITFKTSQKPFNFNGLLNYTQHHQRGTRLEPTKPEKTSETTAQLEKNKIERT